MRLPIRPCRQTPLLLPPKIDTSFSSRTVAFTQAATYVVQDGIIWRRNQGDPRFRQWSPKSLPKIVEVLADGDFIVAIDVQRRVHTFQTNPSLVSVSGIHTEPQWNDTWGAPFDTPFFMPENFRSYALGRRSTPASGYLEDPLGNRIKAGGDGAPSMEDRALHSGLTHIYALSKDGTRLHYADTGLPAGFAQEFDMPERGRFIARSVAASGSIVMLLGERGAIYTALRDYDISGNNPMMFDYSFDKVMRAQDGKHDEHLYGLVNLPREPWKKQPDIPLDGDAAIGPRVTMLQTGEGNSARELRVQGQDAHGRYGYYTKMIDARDWRFVATGERFSEIVATQQTDRKGYARAPSKDLTFTSEAMSLRDFNLTASPCKLELTLPSGKRVTATLHTTDAWAPYAIAQEPKLFLAHLSDIDDPEFKAAVEALPNQPFPFLLEASSTGARLYDGTLLDVSVGTQKRGDGQLAQYRWLALSVTAIAFICRCLFLDRLPALGPIPPFGKMVTWGSRLVEAHYQMWKRYQRPRPYHL